MKTDVISDMLTRIRNANLEKHSCVLVPYTKITLAIADVLLKKKFISRFECYPNRSVKVTQRIKFHSSLAIFLKYDGKERSPWITSIDRVSRPGLRSYTTVKAMPRVLNGYGMAVLSTSQGIMSDQSAREKGIGGELLFYIY